MDTLVALTHPRSATSSPAMSGSRSRCRSGSTTASSGSGWWRMPRGDRYGSRSTRTPHPGSRRCGKPGSAGSPVARCPGDLSCARARCGGILQRPAMEVHRCARRRLSRPRALRRRAAPRGQRPVLVRPVLSLRLELRCRTAPPLGLYVRAVAEGGRYVTLEDGSCGRWRSPIAATSAAWPPEDFVSLHPIWAPRHDYEYLLNRPAIWSSGRRFAWPAAARPAYRSDHTDPSGVVPPHLRRHAVEIGEEPPLVDRPPDPTGRGTAPPRSPGSRTW